MAITKMLITKGRTDVLIRLLMMDPSEAPIKKKQVPYTEEAMPAVFPMGSIASALLLGSTAKLIPIRTATALKKNTKLGGSPVTKVKSSNIVPAAA